MKILLRSFGLVLLLGTAPLAAAQPVMHAAPAHRSSGLRHVLPVTTGVAVGAFIAPFLLVGAAMSCDSPNVDCSYNQLLFGGIFITATLISAAIVYGLQALVAKTVHAAKSMR